MFRISRKESNSKVRIEIALQFIFFVTLRNEVPRQAHRHNPNYDCSAQLCVDVSEKEVEHMMIHYLPTAASASFT